MQHKKTVSVPATEKEVIDHTTCDLCEAVITGGRPGTAFGVDEVEVSREVGDRYPGSGDITKYQYDICGKCFEDKLVPWLEGQGAKPRKSEMSW